MSLFEQLKNAFAAFDTNGDGHITVNELQKFMTEFGIECDEEQVQEIVDQMDIDKSGSIELCEFLPMWQKNDPKHDQKPDRAKAAAVYLQ
jgi:calmodulin